MFVYGGVGVFTQHHHEINRNEVKVWGPQRSSLVITHKFDTLPIQKSIKNWEFLMMHQFNDKKWLKNQWETSNFGDVRLNKRIVKLAEKILTNPHLGLPLQTQNWAELKGAYRFLSNNKVNHQEIQSQHYANVFEEAEKRKQPILYIQDTTELDFSSHESKKNELGPLGDYKRVGIMLHSCLAIVPGKMTSIIGLAHQIPWIRSDNAGRRKIETKAQRKKRDRESMFWEKTLQSIGNPPNDSTWISVGDRGNDIFNFLYYCSTTNWNYLIRVTQNRCIITSSNEKHCLKDYMRNLSSQGTKTITLRTRNGTQARTVKLNVAYDKVIVIVPSNHKRNTYKPIEAWSVRCWEESPDGLDWILLTNIKVANLADALQTIDWYAARWIIEEYHKCLKTGCAIERSQLKTAQSLLALIGLMCVIATKLLTLKYLAREDNDILAKIHVPLPPLKIICHLFNFNQDAITIRQFWHKVASLGGFIGRKSDGDPGWQTLWKGWLRLLDMQSGAKILETCG
jgi:Transposase DNA-binding/Transposase DDE domain